MNELFEYEAVEQVYGDAFHLEACDYTYKATLKERIEHYATKEPACDGFTEPRKNQWGVRPREGLVRVPSRRQGKDVIHRITCPYAGQAQRVELVYEARPDHRINRTCGHCLKGQSTFSLWA